MLVVKVGGCNGSGKTSVARALMDLVGCTPLEYKKDKPYVYASGQRPDLKGHRLVVLGSYGSVCGGMDTISDKDERLQLVRDYARPLTANVVFYEGLITGKTYGAMGAMSDEPTQKGRWLYTFMDTPFEVCVRRVMSRRTERAIAKGMDPIDALKYGAELDAERTMRPTFKSVHSTAKRAEDAGHHVHWINHEQSPKDAAKALIKRVKGIL